VVGGGGGETVAAKPSLHFYYNWNLKLELQDLLEGGIRGLNRARITANHRRAMYCNTFATAQEAV
jgi:hypothetical protein